ncbi:hypothetical protein ABPG77_008577 [Micractinium sp. CCAP 211/92]
MRAIASVAAPRAGAGAGLGTVVCVARSDGKKPRSARPAAPRAGPSTPLQAQAARGAAAAPVAQVAATPVALPATLQGTLVSDKPARVQRVRGRQGPQQGADRQGATVPPPGKDQLADPSRGQEGKRRDRRRRRLAKQRAETAAAAAAAAGAALALLSGSEVAGQQQEQQEGTEQQAQKRRRPRRKRQAQDSSGSSDGGTQLPARERQIPISPKEEDLLRWYADVSAAAEQAHRAASTAAARGLRRREAASAPRPPVTLAASLQAPIQSWLDERLDYMGFEARQFPALQPLDVAWRRQQAAARQKQQPEQQPAAEQGGDGQEEEPVVAAEAASTSSSSSNDDSGSSEGGHGGRGCTTATFARWAQAAGGQLPLLASQWHRGAGGWELGRPGRQLLQEAHAAHEWGGAAEEHARAMIGLYEDFARDSAALPVVAGRLPASASLPGAATSYTLQAVVGGGRALEVASAHSLADNYTRLLLGGAADGHQGSGAGGGDLEQQSEAEGQDSLLFSQMGSGLQAALLGGMALVHGDDAGLRLPPALAPVQVMIVPLLHYRCDRGAMAAEAERLRVVLAAAGVRVEVDWRRRGPAGVRFGDSERRGVPLRIELGPRDLKQRTCVIAQRFQPGGDGKLQGVSTDPDALVDTVNSLLDDAQSDLRWAAAGTLETAIVDVTSFYELREVVESGLLARGPWAGSPEDEAAVAEETGARLLCIPLAQPTSLWGGFHTCLYSGYQATEVALFGRPL